jgi:hypothetical protein
MKIRCLTLFDITETGITGHFRPTQIPFTNRVGNTISNITDWNRSRNQQRNFETITQVLQLRTQIFDVTAPTKNGKWEFEFDVEANEIYQLDQDTFGILKQDCEDVPMIVGLDDEYVLTPSLVTSGSQQNIWFELISVNN